jgi:hypothetical protein
MSIKSRWVESMIYGDPQIMKNGHGFLKEYGEWCDVYCDGKFLSKN